MKRAILLAMLLCGPAAADSPADLGVYVVRGASQRCSAVAIEPGVAVTSKHCGELKVLLLPNGRQLPINSRQPAPDVDAQVLRVPGLQCPCLPLMRVALIGDAAAIGFTGEGPAVTVGKLVGYGFVGPVGQSERVLIHTALVAPGVSGGALIQRGENGVMRLVGILMGYNDGGSFAVFVGDVPGLVAR